MEQKTYQKVLKNEKIKRPIFMNVLRAFIIGGIVGLIAQGLLTLYLSVLDFEKATSSSLMSITLVFIASILTGFGVYDKIGQFAGAGTYIPITGFANSMTSAALESKSEGLILGIMSNMFKLAGAIIVAGIVSAFFFSSVIYLVGIIW